MESTEYDLAKLTHGRVKVEKQLPVCGKRKENVPVRGCTW